ncbi:transglycosylase SLT domain-containing protein [Cupriavidus campinensis]|uniref:transglycosylase SLT domain-containing protein n=1 Tax=Cupriavidus campinensis TaxID=151783 RepID=UPI0024E25576|nr:transglycosylase SLT domain-containing protein [Cupriavidus campinensis]
MIDGMLQDSIDQTLDDRQQRPVAPPRPQSGFSVWNTIKAPVVGAAAGGVEAGGFGADVIGAFGAAGAFASQADPTQLLSPEDMDKRRRDADDARAQLDSGEAFSSEIGTGLRSTARGMMPDPATSNAVEQTLFQLGRFGGKAVGYSLLAGPAVGAALTAGDEGMTEADRLKAEGVDIGTRTRVGAVAGAAAGLGVALPVAGRTIAQTAALVVAGGPGAYIAQQAASREILKNADYTKVADQYDPFDPVGLAVSTLVPAGFGAWAARGMRGAAKPAPAGDAAASRALVDMGGAERKALPYNDPRLDAYAVTAAQREGIPPEALLAIKNVGERSKSSAATSPVGAKGIMQFMDSTWTAYGKGDVRDPVANIDGAARYMKDLIQQYGGDVRAAIAHYNGGGKAGDAVRAGKAPPAAETRAYLERTDRFMAEHAGEAAGRAAAGDPDAVAAARTQLIRDTVDSWNLKDPTDIAAAQDHLAAVVRASDQLGAGDRVDVSSTIQWDTLQQTRMLDDMVGRLEAGRADLLPEVGQAAEPGAIRQLRTEIDQLRRAAPDNSDEAIRARAKELQAEGDGRVSYKQAQAAARKEITAALDEHRARLDALEQQVETNRSAEQSRQALQQVDQQISAAKAARAALDAPPSPIKPTALAAKQAAKEAPPKAAEAGGIPPLTETPGGNTATEPASGATKPAGSETGAQAAAAHVDAQAAEIAKLSPDMMVQLEGMDAPVRVADALEAIRKEAEADAADAPLIQAAAECFLRNT